MKFESVDVRQTASAADIIFAALRKAIVEGDLKEGEHLRQDHIARLFNASRIPVREALTRLEQDGLVTTERYKGTVVAGLSVPEIEEIFEFRALVEGETIRLAVPLMTAEMLDEAERWCRAFATEPDPSKWGEINRNFHYSLYRASARPYYLQIVGTSLDRIDRYLRAQLTLTDGMARARKDHDAILEACKKRDADEACRLTRIHILDASASLTAFLTAQRAG